MEGKNCIWLVTVVISSMAMACYGAPAAPLRPFSDLKNTLFVEATASNKGDLMAGVDEIELKWGPSKTATKEDNQQYKTVKLKLCYTPISQEDRPWRKTHLDNIAKDKTCQFVIFESDYSNSIQNATYKIEKEVPSAVYFIRAYAFDSAGKELAYGQTSPQNPFTVIGITGRSTSINVASGVFSAFSVLSLGFFFYIEKRKAKKDAAAN